MLCWINKIATGNNTNIYSLWRLECLSLMPRGQPEYPSNIGLATSKHKFSPARTGIDVTPHAMLEMMTKATPRNAHIYSNRKQRWTTLSASNITPRIISIIHSVIERLAGMQCRRIDLFNLNLSPDPSTEEWTKKKSKQYKYKIIWNSWDVIGMRRAAHTDKNGMPTTEWIIIDFNFNYWIFYVVTHRRRVMYTGIYGCWCMREW